jgi:signal transduction histidine kinase
MKTKTNRKYLALLFLLITMPLIIFCSYILTMLVVSIFIYIKYGDFIFDRYDFYTAFKLAPLGLIAGVIIWFGECRRLGIKIFGK